LSRVLGYPLRERVAGSDLVPKLLERCGRQRHGVYFFGSDRATLEAAKVIVEARYPGLRVVGIDAPPVGAVIEWDNDALGARMRASGAQLLLVCLGCPKQERWIFAHHRETGIPLSIGVGASLDFITGKQQRAPRWMQKSGTEWFWRMANSPKRLAHRYRKDLVFLLRAAWQQARAQRRRKGIAAPPQPRPHLTIQDPTLIRLEWFGALRQRGLDGAPVPDQITAPVLLDASQVAYMDSSGLGRLAVLIRRCRTAQQLLVVVQPSEAFKALVRDVRMDSLFLMVDSDADAVRRVAAHLASGGLSKEAEDGVVWVAFNRSLDALYYDEMMSILDDAIADSTGLRVLVVDLQDVAFLDSRAVGGLIRTWKTMSSTGGSMYLARANPAVREIIALLRLDKVLAEWKGVLPP